MAARKKTSKRKAAPKRKARTAATKRKAVKRTAALRSVPHGLPNDDAWRELVETAIEKPDPDVSAVASRGKKK